MDTINSNQIKDKQIDNIDIDHILIASHTNGRYSKSIKMLVYTTDGIMNVVFVIQKKDLSKVIRTTLKEAVQEYNKSIL